MRLNESYLSKREQQIIELILQHERLSANEIVDLMEGAISNSSVRTFLRILEEKGHLSHVEEGGKFVYSFTQTRQVAGEGALKKVVQTFYQGSIGSAVAALVGDGQKLSTGEIDELQMLIDEARKNAGDGR